LTVFSGVCVYNKFKYAFRFCSPSHGHLCMYLFFLWYLPTFFVFFKGTTRTPPDLFTVPTAEQCSLCPVITLQSHFYVCIVMFPSSH
jgi:hypothetical protein